MNKLKAGIIYSLSSLLRRAAAFVTLMDSSWARSTMDLRFLDDTPWAISAQYFRFCIISISNSCGEIKYDEEIHKFYKATVRQDPLSRGLVYISPIPHSNSTTLTLTLCTNTLRNPVGIICLVFFAVP